MSKFQQHCYEFKLDPDQNGSIVLDSKKSKKMHKKRKITIHILKSWMFSLRTYFMEVSEENLAILYKKLRLESLFTKTAWILIILTRIHQTVRREVLYCGSSCSGSLMIWSGSADPYHWITDPDPAIFLSGLHKMPTKKAFLNLLFPVLQ